MWEVLEIVLITMGVMLFASGILSVAFYIRRLEGDVTRLEQMLNSLTEEFKALCSGAVGLTERVSGIENRFDKVTERQKQTELSALPNSSFQQAKRMVQLGADSDDIINACGLSPAEAELVVIMNKKRQVLDVDAAEIPAEQTAQKNVY